MSIILDILIPTFNRADKLTKNLDLICSQISILKKEANIRIIIVDNCSTDNTYKVLLKKIADLNTVKIDLYRNSENIGLYNNIIKVLSYSAAPFIMYLGDDDFIPLTYWENVFALLEKDSDLGFIKPARQEINFNYEVPIPLNTGLATVKSYTKDLKNTLFLSSNCNQLSGLVYKNIGLYQRLVNEKVLNVYPFMTLAGWALEQHNGYSIEGSPILITDGVKKDWGYGKDGTLGDIVDNVKFFLGHSYRKRLIGEFYFANRWKWFLSIVIHKGFYHFLVCIKTLLQDKRLLLSTRIFFIYLSGYIQFRILIYHCKRWVLKTPLE